MDNQLQALLKLPGMSGDEKEVFDYLIQQFQQHTPILKTDKLGSLFAILNGKNNDDTIMLSTNMDESGMIVTNINNDGTLSFLCVGHYTKEQVYNQHVTVLTRTHERVDGIVVKKQDDYVIATGKINKDDIVKQHIQIGDTVVINSPIVIKDNMVLSHNLNNRLCLWALIKLFEQLQDKSLSYKTAIGGITHSVTGFRGAITATHTIQPSIAIILDASYIAQQQKHTIYIRAFDKTLIPNYQLIDDIVSLATKKGYNVVKYTQEKGTDGSFIHKTLSGAPSVVLGLPLQYEDSMVNSIDLSNVETLIHFLVDFLTEYDGSHLLPHRK